MALKYTMPMAEPGGNNIRAGTDFFIPDLCATRPVLMLVILAELLVLVYVLGDSALPHFSWGRLAIASLFLQWIVLLCAALLCAFRGALGRISLPAGVLFSYLIILLVTLFSSFMAQVLFSESALFEMDAWWLLRNQLVALVVGGIALRYFYIQQQLREREQAELNARLESLRARIRPHFLFNTMNSIASLISSRPDEAEQVVEDLSELFRSSLIDGDEQDATIADELHLCRLYLRIEKLRLGDRMQVEWHVDDELLPKHMPALILQPLVENAVYHGVARMPEGGTISISMQREGDKLHIQVDNPVPEGKTPASAGHNMALDNIQQRLQALYGDDARFRAERVPGGHRVLLSYPLAEPQL